MPAQPAPSTGEEPVPETKPEEKSSRWVFEAITFVIVMAPLVFFFVMANRDDHVGPPPPNPAASADAGPAASASTLAPPLPSGLKPSP